MRHEEPIADPSFRHPSYKQYPIEPVELVRLLSHDMALGTWEAWGRHTETLVGLLNLQRAIEEIGYVSKTLPALQEIWRSMPYQDQKWVAIRLITGDFWHSEWAGVKPMADGLPTELDKSRIKALGNTLVPEIPYRIGRTIIQFERELMKAA